MSTHICNGFELKSAICKYLRYLTFSGISGISFLLTSNSYKLTKFAKSGGNRQISLSDRLKRFNFVKRNNP